MNSSMKIGPSFNGVANYKIIGALKEVSVATKEGQDAITKQLAKIISPINGQVPREVPATNTVKELWTHLQMCLKKNLGDISEISEFVQSSDGVFVKIKTEAGDEILIGHSYSDAPMVLE